MKVKLSVAGGAVESGVRRVVWAGPGVLATATGESLVRFWNLAADENYVLSLGAAGVSRGDKATAVAFNPLQRYLAVGTQGGKVAMWRFIGEYSGKKAAGGGGAGGALDDAAAAKGGKGAGAARDKLGAAVKTTTAADWEPMPPASVGAGDGGADSRIGLLAWGPRQGLLAAAVDDGCSLLGETVLHRLLSPHGVAALQLSSDAVRIERRDEAAGEQLFVRTDVSIRGLALAEHHLLAWSGHEAQVFELGALHAEPVASFATTSRAMAMRGETIFRCVGQNVELTNLGGASVRSRIAFTPAQSAASTPGSVALAGLGPAPASHKGEGAPILLDINGPYLAVMTDAGVIRIFQIDRREPKQLGSAGHFVDKVRARAREDHT